MKKSLKLLEIVILGRVTLFDVINPLSNGKVIVEAGQEILDQHVKIISKIPNR